MERVLRVVDDFVFDTPKVGIQTLASKIEYFTSVRPTAVARLMFVIAVALTVWVFFNEYQVHQQPLSLVWIVAWLALGYKMVGNTYASERINKPGSRNSWRVSDRFMTLRVLSLYLACLMLVVYVRSWQLDLINMTFVALGTYFASCDQLPPGDRYQLRKKVLN